MTNITVKTSKKAYVLPVAVLSAAALGVVIYLSPKHGIEKEETPQERIKDVREYIVHNDYPSARKMLEGYTAAQLISKEDAVKLSVDIDKFESDYQELRKNSDARERFNIFIENKDLRSADSLIKHTEVSTSTFKDLTSELNNYKEENLFKNAMSIENGGFKDTYLDWYPNNKNAKKVLTKIVDASLATIKDDAANNNYENIMSAIGSELDDLKDYNEHFQRHSVKQDMKSEVSGLIKLLRSKVDSIQYTEDIDAEVGSLVEFATPEDMDADRFPVEYTTERNKNIAQKSRGRLVGMGSAPDDANFGIYWVKFDGKPINWSVGWNVLKDYSDKGRVAAFTGPEISVINVLKQDDRKAYLQKVDELARFFEK